VRGAGDGCRMDLDQLAQGDAHRLLDVARLLDMTRDAEELGAGVVRPADRREPGGAAPHDVGDLRDGLDIVDRRRAAIEADIGGETRLLGRRPPLCPPAFAPRPSPSPPPPPAPPL